MENEVLQTVLTEVLEELKEVKEQQAMTTRSIQEVRDKVEWIGRKLPDGITKPPAMEVDVMTRSINEGFDRVKTLFEAQQKSITRQFKILFFPEHNAMEYYKIVFGRLLFWMFVFLIAAYLFVIAKQAITEHFKVKQIEAEASQYRKAWSNLYGNSIKVIKKKMDSAWIKAW